MKIWIRIICICIVMCTMTALLCTAFADTICRIKIPEFIEKPNASTPICGGLISLVCGAMCIFLCTRPALYEYKGKIIFLSILLVLFGIVQLLVGLVPAFRTWIFGFLPI